MVGFEVSLVVGELRSSDSWAYVVAYLNHLFICGLWLSMNPVFGMPLELDEITQTHDVGVSCFFSAKVPVKSRLEKGGFYE